jgi:hypothetical protein
VNSRRLRVVFVVHRTTTILDRAGGPTVGSVEPSTTALGDWYATVDLVDRTHGRGHRRGAAGRARHTDVAAMLSRAWASWMPVHTARPPCPGRGRRRCHPEHCVGDRPNRISRARGRQGGWGRLAAALAIPGVRVACIGLTSWTASRRTGSAMSSGQLGQPPPVLDPGGDRRSCGQFRQRRVRSRRRKRTGGRAARRVDRETAGTRHGRETRRLHAPSGPVDSGLKSSIRGR